MGRPKGSRNKPKATGVYLYVPATFVVADFPELAGHEDEAHWLVHKVIVGAMFRRHDPYNNGMVNISRETMRDFIHRNHVSLVRNTLVDAGVLICNPAFRISTVVSRGYSQAYGLHPDYAGGVRRVEVRSPTMASKIRAGRIARGLREAEPEERQAAHQYLVDCLRRVSIDINAAYELSEPLSSVPKVRKVRVGRRGRRRIVQAAMPSARALTRMIIDTIADGDFYTVICPYGRFHTPHTCLATACRAALHINGRPLATIDIKNSQLVFALLLLLQDRYKGQGNSTQSTHTHRGARYSAGELSQDERQFKDDVLNGTIYDKLMSDVRTTDRRAFKGEFFKGVLYGDNARPYSTNSPITRAFAARYPTVLEWIIRTKAFRGTGHGADAYKQLARDMQRAESNFLIGRVCGRLARSHSDVTVVTIHDSILCLPEQVAFVKRLMLEEFRRLGVEPQVKIEWPESDGLHQVAA